MSIHEDIVRYKAAAALGYAVLDFMEPEIERIIEERLAHLVIESPNITLAEALDTLPPPSKVVDVDSGGAGAE